MRKLLFSGAVLATIFAACTKNNFEREHPVIVKPVAPITPVTPTTPTTSRDTCKDSIRYNPDIKRILNANCATSGCHDQGNQFPDLSNFTSSHESADRIKVRACDIQDMPTSGPLTNTCDIDKIKAWVAQGALENR